MSEDATPYEGLTELVRHRIETNSFSDEGDAYSSLCRLCYAEGAASRDEREYPEWDGIRNEIRDVRQMLEQYLGIDPVLPPAR